MFLDTVVQRNPQLVDLAIELHQSGTIPPNTYVFDSDSIVDNARLISEASNAHGITPWFITKQFGRNPLIASRIATVMPSCTVVDFTEYSRMLSAGVHVANVGHLVQPPVRWLNQIIANNPDFMTVSSMDMINVLNEVAGSRDVIQPIMLKFATPPDILYPGQEGGFELEDLDEISAVVDALPHIRLAGVTGFPAVLFNYDSQSPGLTGLTEKVVSARSTLEARFGDLALCLPSHSSVSSIPLLAEIGATHIEPGHALTGTTPEHAVVDAAEKPAYVYVSEVSQTGSTTTISGGGFYPRGHAKNVLLCTSEGKRNHASLIDGSATNIDYYRSIETRAPVSLGDTAIMSFRTQVFVTHAYVAVVSTKNSTLDGLFDAQGLPEELPRG